MLQAYAEGIIFRLLLQWATFRPCRNAVHLNRSLTSGNWGIQAGDALESCTVILICIILSTTFQNIHLERLKVMLYNKEVIIKKMLLTWNIYNQKNKYSGSSPED